MANPNFRVKVGKKAGKIRKIAKMHFLTLFFTIPKLIEKLKMPRFITSGHTLSSQDQIINVFEFLFFIKKIGHFRPFCGVTEPNPSLF